MSDSVVSKYIFHVADDRRTFHHYQYYGGVKQDCPSCLNVCKDNEPYSRHWEKKSSTRKKLSSAEEKLLNDIDAKEINTFFLCDQSATPQTRDFLLDAGISAIPDLLRFLFYNASKLIVRLGFYSVPPNSRDILLFESNPLEIDHHFDIEESIDVIFTMLLQKIRSYLYCRYRCSESTGRIKRIRLSVQRVLIDGYLELPLKYRIKKDQRSKESTPELPEQEATEVTPKFIKCNSGTFDPRIAKDPNINMYCFQKCALTKEVYVVPHTINSAEGNDTHRLLMLEDVTGQFCGFYKIKQLKNFLRPFKEHELLTCEQCKMHISSKIESEVHKKIKCDQNFDILQLDNDVTEIYQNILVFPQQLFNYNWYGMRNQ